MKKKYLLKTLLNTLSSSIMTSFRSCVKCKIGMHTTVIIGVGWGGGGHYISIFGVRKKRIGVSENKCVFRNKQMLNE